MAKCDQCGEEFEAKRSDARFCSAGCRKRASRDTTLVQDMDTPEPDTAEADTSDRQKADELLAEAKRLAQLQKDERGMVPGPEIDGKRLEVPGPYVPTPEREERARKIISLRKSAASLRYPTPGKAPLALATLPNESPEEIKAVIAENPKQYGPASARLLIAQRNSKGTNAHRR